MSPLEAFLNAVWGAGLHSLCWSSPSVRFGVDFMRTPADLIRELPAFNKIGADVWFGAHALRGRPASGYGRGSAADIDEIVAIPADLDWEHWTRKTDEALPSEVEVRSWLGKLGPELQPSIVINSGHGLQTWWLLRDALSAAEGAALIAQLNAGLAAVGLVNGRPDLASILRVPTTFNHKGKPIEVVVERLDASKLYVAEYMSKRLPTGARIMSIGAGGTRHRRGSVTDEQQALVEYLIDNHGAHGTYVASDGSVHLTRPGKAASDGSSASVITGEQGDAIVTVYSPHWPALGPQSGEGYRSWRLADGALVPAHIDPLHGVTIMPTTPANMLGTAAQLPLPGMESTWVPLDLGPVMAEGYAQPRPTVLPRSDLESDGALFYAAAINGVHGDSGSGKGWVACAAIKAEIVNGRTAVLVDLEDTPGSIVARLRLLGVRDVDIIERLVYIRPTEPPTIDDIGALTALVIERHVSLFVVDSLGEAFGLDGVDENHDVEVGPWLRRNLRPIADAGAAVLIIDHATKAADNPLHPSGSKRKRAAITGASYLINVIVPLVKGEGGALDLVCAKDRHGNYRRGEVVSRMLMTSDIEVRLRFDVPKVRTVEGEPTVDTRDAVTRLAEVAIAVCKGRQPAPSQRQMKTLVRERFGKVHDNDIIAGIELAADLGGIEIIPDSPAPRAPARHYWRRDVPELALPLEDESTDE